MRARNSYEMLKDTYVKPLLDERRNPALAGDCFASLRSARNDKGERCCPNNLRALGVLRGLAFESAASLLPLRLGVNPLTP